MPPVRKRTTNAARRQQQQKQKQKKKRKTTTTTTTTRRQNRSRADRPIKEEQAPEELPGPCGDERQTPAAAIPDDLPFCTQRCLWGLRFRSRLDNDCPNVAYHNKRKRSVYHEVTVTEFLSLISKQLAHDDLSSDRYFNPMGPFHITGAPFKITCTEYGYTFVGKGATSGAWPEVTAEAFRYNTLHRLQGAAIPVCMGRIDLKYPYTLPAIPEIQTIKHLLLMAYGGRPLVDRGKGILDMLQAEIERSMEDMRSSHIYYDRAQPSDMLWNEELKRILIIGFGSASCGGGEQLLSLV